MASAQVKSCVLLAGLYACRRADCRSSSRSRRATTPSDCSRRPGPASAGAPAKSVWPADRLQPLTIEIPGDFSSAAPFVAAATLLPDSRLVVRGVGVNPTRTGFLSVLERMGARVAVFNRRLQGGEPVADLEVEHAELDATEVRPEEVPLLVDELPLFALVAGMAHGESVVRGAEELRVKESDRLESCQRSATTPWSPDRDDAGWPPGSWRTLPPQGRGRDRCSRRPPDRDARGGGGARLQGGGRDRGRRKRRCKLPRLLRDPRLARCQVIRPTQAPFRRSRGEVRLAGVRAP